MYCGVGKCSTEERLKCYLYEALLEAVRTVGLGVGCKADQVEVPAKYAREYFRVCEEWL